MSARKVITAPEQEANLPYGTVVLLADGYAAQLSHWSPGRRWHRVDSTYLTAFNETVLPALVLYEPDDSEDAVERQHEWMGEGRLSPLRTWLPVPQSSSVPAPGRHEAH